MTRFKHYDYHQMSMVVINDQGQLPLGSFEHVQGLKFRYE